MATLESFSLAGQVALVTGVNGDIGAALARGLAEAGADVAGTSRRQPVPVADAIRELGRRFLPIQADLTDDGAPSRVVEEAVAGLGRLDILVNNAGATARKPAIEWTADEWDSLMAINLRALFLLSQAASRHFLRLGRGKIINIASLLSFQGGVLVPAYAASKHAVSGLTKALANEWASLGINVNAIAPGYVVTRMNEALLRDPARHASISERIPAGRWAQPADLQGAAVFLASAASDYVHGITLPVDGGWLGR